MSSRTKRRLEDFDPNASDPEDLDYGADSPRPQKRRSKPSKSTPKRPSKRQRRGYGDSDDDIVDEEDDEITEDSFASASGEDEDDEDIPINPRTGRRVRNVTTKDIKYEEPDSDVEESIEESDTETRRGGATSQKLVVKLKIPGLKGGMNYNARATRAGSRARASPTPKPHPSHAIRRSSRISHDEQETIIALTNSGKHAEIVRAGTRSPEPEIARQIKGGKGLKKPPSAIMEASQENSHPSFQAEPNEDDELAGSPPHDDVQAQVASSDVQSNRGSDTNPDMDEEDKLEMSGVIQESVHEEEDDEDDEGPVTRTGRSLRVRNQPDARPERSTTRGSQRRKRSGDEESSDFEPPPEEGAGDESDSGASQAKSPNGETSDSATGRRSRRLAGRSQRSRRSHESDDEIDHEELAEEAEELRELNAKRRRTSRRARDHQIAYDEPKLRNRGPKVDYRIYRPELAAMLDHDDDVAIPTATPSRKRGAAPYRSLFPMAGPFGGAGGPVPLFGAPGAAGAIGGVDSDSSDDDMIGRGVGRGFGGAVGMTPTTAMAPSLLPQPHNNDPLQGRSGAQDQFGKIKDKKTLADADPLGVDVNVTFDGVGGLDDHINRLREMVMLPLLYPEIFLRFKTTPPRGVLFHGPPGTGKTLLARALASSVSSQGKKVTFYMRKGADALSKWVGEAERQLRLLFEEARKTQPSIIFFDEIDGLAPVRSSKQEQIHASIVATLLALMDGMDGRGQVIVIGATNRPDSVDPALRRPGRFDREFYFPLPETKARRAIIDIHTKGWEPPLNPAFKDQLAELTNGYGGADLRALCTEAALNAVQGTFPQIYSSNQKLIIEPSKIKVLAKDFMISVNKMIPSSERSGSAAAQPLSKGIQPLLRETLDDIANILNETLPRRKKLTALEEAMYDDREDEVGFEKETMHRDFERARIYRPRLLISGVQGMGQQYLGSALLSKLEQMHVQTFDLPTILEDSTRAPEAAVVQLFKEAKRHKPSIIFIPDVDIWYTTISDVARNTFLSMLRKLPPNDPVLVLGILELQSEDDKPDPVLLRDLFGFSKNNIFQLQRPREAARHEYFETIISYIRKPPTEFPNPENRVKRELPELPVAPAEKAPEGPSKEQLKAQKKQDRHTLNLLKLQIQPVMEQIKIKYKKFRAPVIDESQIAYLYDEQDPGILTTDLTEEQRIEQEIYRPYKVDKDHHGEPGLREVATGKFYYNLDIVVIERRLSNGYYKRPQDFLTDIKRLAKDAATCGDADRTLKANEMRANVEVDMGMIDSTFPQLAAECEAVYAREKAREKEVAQKSKILSENSAQAVDLTVGSEVAQTQSLATESTGPVVLGEIVPGRPPVPPLTPKHKRTVQSGASNVESGDTGDSTHLQSNGSTVPSRIVEDVVMEGSQDIPASNQGTQNPVFTPGGLSTQPRSQQSGIQRMAQGTQPSDYQNSASTTTSGQKTSDRSNRTSDRSNFNNTQSTNGAGPYPDFSTMPAMSGGSQIPDTQGRFPLLHAGISSSFDSLGSNDSDNVSTEAAYPSSQQTGSQTSQHFVAPGLPASRQQLSQPAATQASTSNTTAFPIALPSSLNASEPATLVLDKVVLEALHKQLVKRTSGLSVEQLEQVNATLMDAVWKSRTKWNRNAVIASVEEAFNGIIADVEEMQRVLGPTQSSEH